MLLEHPPEITYFQKAMFLEIQGVECRVFFYPESVLNARSDKVDGHFMVTQSLYELSELAPGCFTEDLLWILDRTIYSSPQLHRD